MDAKRRNDITRAEKDGIYVEKSDDFPQIFALVEKTFERQDKQLKPSVFREAAFQYNEILRQRKLCTSFLARNKDGKAIAAVYIVWDERRSYYLLGGYDFEERHHGASAMAMWEAIRFTKTELGLDEFDFEGSMVERIERFFRAFGGRQVPYFWVRNDSRTALMKIAARARRAVQRFARKPYPQR
jgi:lipid II:glycine glycyltransferase (peptidoglycan interpeptide bridge formation enzyme)